MAEFQSIKCPNTECTVAITGKCVEAYELAVCPYLLKAQSDDEDEEEEDVGGEEKEGIQIDSPVSVVPVRKPDPDSIALSPGVKLPLKEASALQKKADTRILAIIGPYDSGKTSLIGALYNLFLDGPVAGYQFSGSNTLLAFEQASHDIRAASGRHEPEMEHTGHTPLPSGISFYHLSVRSQDKQIIHLLLGDRTGEEYKNAGNDPSATEDFVEVQSADNLTFLVNGAELLKLETRENAKAAVFSILQGLIDGSVIRPTHRLLVCLTKLDKIDEADSAQQEKVIQVFDKLVANVQRVFGSKFAEISSLKIAASPKNSKRTFGYEVDSVLKFWTKKTSKQTEKATVNPLLSKRSVGRYRHE